MNLFKNNGRLEADELRQTHENLSLVLESNIGIFVFDKLKVIKKIFKFFRLIFFFGHFNLKFSFNLM